MRINSPAHRSCQFGTALPTVRGWHCTCCALRECIPVCREVYDAGSPGYRGRCTAPLLVDRLQRRLVCNESSDIVRMLNLLRLPGASDVDLYPADAAAEIDAVNQLVHNDVRGRPSACLSHT